MKLRDIVLIALVCANVTLAALGVALFAAHLETPAEAAVGSRGGDYLMVTGPITTSRDALLVIDVVAQRANLYVPKAGAGAGGTKWELVSTRSLAADFGVPR